MFTRIARVVGNLFTVVDDSIPSNRVRLACEGLEDRCTPATFTVLNLNDDGDDSLRDCMRKANAQAGADVINFNNGLNGTVTLLSPLDTITEAVEITGRGAANTTIERSSAAETPAFRIFTIAGAKKNGNNYTPVPATIKDLTVKNGKAQLATNATTGNPIPGSAWGGGIAHTNSVIGQRTAPLLTLMGVNIENCTADNEGGGLYNRNKVLLTNCKVTGNSSHSDGGGLAVYSVDTKLENCLVKDNTCTSDGGGIYAEPGYTGVVYADTYRRGTLQLVNTEVNHNTAGNDGGGLCAYIHRVEVVQDTYTVIVSGATGKFVKNEAANSGGAVWSDAISQFTDTIFEDNLGGNNGYAIYNAAAYRGSGVGEYEFMKLIHCEVRQNRYTPAPGSPLPADVAAVASPPKDAGENAKPQIEFTTTKVVGLLAGHGVGSTVATKKAFVFSGGNNFIDTSLTTSEGWVPTDSVN